MTWFPSAAEHVAKAEDFERGAGLHQAQANQFAKEANAARVGSEEEARARCALHECRQSATELLAAMHDEYALAWYKQANVLGASGPSTPDERAAAGAIADGWIATGSCAADLARVARQAVNEVRLAILEDWCERVAGEGSPEERRERVLEAIREANR